MESMGSRRGAWVGLFAVALLAWSGLRVAAAEAEAAARQAFWKGQLREAFEGYRALRRLAIWNPAGLKGEREVYVAALESPPLLASELGQSFAEAGKQLAQILGRQVERAPLDPETWVGISDFYGALKPENQRRRVYFLEEISTRLEKNLAPEDVLQIRSLEEAVRLDRNSIYYHDVLGDMAWGLGLRDLALMNYRDSIILYPDQTQHLFLIEARRDADLARVGVEGMARAVEPPRRADPETVYRNLGIFLLGLDRFREARESFRKAQGANPMGNYFTWQAYAEERQGHIGEAVRLYRAALFSERLDTDTRFRTHLNLGDLLEQQGKHQEAAQEVRNALLLRPRDPRALLVLGKIYESLGLVSEAEEQYLRAAQSSVERITPLVNLVEFYRRAGRPEDALVPARKLIALQPEEEIYREQLRQLEREMASPGRY